MKLPKPAGLLETFCQKTLDYQTYFGPRSYNAFGSKTAKPALFLVHIVIPK